MRIGGNTLSHIKIFFEQELAPFYTADEIRVLFRLAASEINQVSHLSLHLNPEQRVTESNLLKYTAWVKRLKKGEPVQYIMGYTWFLDLKIEVNASVLIPRPETEELVHLCVPFLNERSAASVLDACTGSGCIALAVKSMFRNAQVVGCDISSDALETATANGHALNLEVDWQQIDITNAVNEANFYDLIISNPPYIPYKEAQNVKSQVKDFEPNLALFVSDDDALLFYRHLAKVALHSLKPRGMLAVEVHYDAAQKVAALFTESGLYEVRIAKDMQGQERFVMAFR
ncbi:MAG: peptide chain release factor N(5)-glutamine methyltransferase [Bacteroidia bacterium]|jgi:release factor glutamine methyltransferase